jgi:hypothetical protein
VIHHTNCGMELFSDEIIGDLLEDDLATASFDQSPGRTRTTRAATRRAISSNGKRSRTRRRASCRTYGASASIRLCPQRTDLRLHLRREDRALERSEDGGRSG